MTMYRNQPKRVMKVRLLYYGTNKCEPTELLITINQTSYSMTIEKENACQYMLQFLDTEM